jgi:hypothetical protein
MIGRALALSLLVSSSAAVAAPQTVTYTRVQHRAVFDLVGGKTDLRAVCGGATPTEVTYRRTAADLAAGIFSGWWYSPVHVRVTCSAP